CRVKGRIVDRERFADGRMAQADAAPHQQLARSGLARDPDLRFGAARHSNNAIVDGIVFQRRIERQFGRLPRPATRTDEKRERILIYSKRAYRRAELANGVVLGPTGRVRNPWV